MPSISNLEKRYVYFIDYRIFGLHYSFSILIYVDMFSAILCVKNNLEKMFANDVA